MANEVYSPSIYLQLSSVKAPSGGSFPRLHIPPYKHPAPAQGKGTSYFPSWDSGLYFLGSLLLRATFYTVSRVGALGSISNVSWASSQTLKTPSPPHFNKLRHHGTITLSTTGYFISSSCFSLFSQTQSHLLPCNITSDTFPVTRFFTACCRFFFLNIWGKTVFTLFFPFRIRDITGSLNSLHVYTQWKGESVLTERWMV